jgi:hypothetical protein
MRRPSSKILRAAGCADAHYAIAGGAIQASRRLLGREAAHADDEAGDAVDPAALLVVGKHERPAPRIAG